ncbi:YihY/virulence factor BrkB family protein [Sporanaerobacter acetigenes]|nr:YihY/virulence factor BrkB family protein [Sporanaerobacter acetigenes]
MKIGQNILYDKKDGMDLKLKDNFYHKYKNKRWFEFLDELLYRIKDDEVPAIGGQLTYFLILSIVPFLMFFLNLLKYTSISGLEISDNILITIPLETQALFENIIKETINSSSETLLSFSILLSIWTGSLGINSMIKAINRAYNVETKRPYWRARALSIIFTIVLAFLLVLVLAMLVFGKIIGEKIFTKFGATHVFYHIWEFLRMIIPIVAMITIFALLYKLSPPHEENLNLKFNETLPGAIFASLGWIIASMIFSFYANNFGNYSKIYGSLGGIIILLIWLYIANIVIILGGEINGTYTYFKKKK